MTIERLNKEMQAIKRELEQRNTIVRQYEDKIASLNKANEDRAIQTFLSRLELLRLETYPKSSKESVAYEPDEEEVKIWKHLASQSKLH